MFSVRPTRTLSWGNGKNNLEEETCESRRGSMDGNDECDCQVANPNGGSTEMKMSEAEDKIEKFSQNPEEK